jgi:hypothetical protein
MVSNRHISGNISSHPSGRPIMEQAPAHHPERTRFIPVAKDQISNRQFFDHLARLETHFNPNKTNADHDF